MLNSKHSWLAEAEGWFWKGAFTFYKYMWECIHNIHQCWWFQISAKNMSDGKKTWKGKSVNTKATNHKQNFEWMNQNETWSVVSSMIKTKNYNYLSSVYVILYWRKSDCNGNFENCRIDYISEKIQNLWLVRGLII